MWGFTSVPERWLRGKGGASRRELESYEEVPNYGVLVIQKWKGVVRDAVDVVAEAHKRVIDLGGLWCLFRVIYITISSTSWAPCCRPFALTLSGSPSVGTLFRPIIV